MAETVVGIFAAQRIVLNFAEIEVRYFNVNRVKGKLNEGRTIFVAMPSLVFLLVKIRLQLGVGVCVAGRIVGVFQLCYQLGSLPTELLWVLWMACLLAKELEGASGLSNSNLRIFRLVKITRLARVLRVLRVVQLTTTYRCIDRGRLYRVNVPDVHIMYLKLIQDPTFQFGSSS